MTMAEITEGELLEMAERVRKLEDVIERADMLRAAQWEALRQKSVRLRERSEKIGKYPNSAEAEAYDAEQEQARLELLGIELESRLESVVADFNRLQSIVRR